MPTLDVFEFQYKDDGIVLNTELASEFVDVESVEGLDGAPVRQNVRAKEGLDGSFIQAQFEEHRTIVISGTVYGNEGYLDKLKGNFAPTKKAFPFYFKDDANQDRMVFARALGLNYGWGSMKRLGLTPFQVTLIAGDPTIYSQTEKDVTLNLPTNLSGRAYDREYPYGYGGFSGSPLSSLFNVGNKPVWPVIEIFGDCTNPKITNETTGQFVKLQRSIGVQKSVVIDMQERMVLLDGVESIRGDMTEDSYWWDLDPGENVIRYTAAAIGGSAAVVTYRDAWR